MDDLAYSWPGLTEDSFACTLIGKSKDSFAPWEKVHLTSPHSPPISVLHRINVTFSVVHSSGTWGLPGCTCHQIFSEVGMPSQTAWDGVQAFHPSTESQGEVKMWDRSRALIPIYITKVVTDSKNTSSVLAVNFYLCKSFPTYIAPK